MPKAILEFSLPEETEEFETAVKAGSLSAALFEVGQRVFRPARKHGYPDQKLQELLNKLDEIEVDTCDGDLSSVVYKVGAGSELVSALEKLFYGVLREYGVEV